MRSTNALICCLAVAVLAAAPAAHGQFGKNKISYETFDWQSYPSPHFDVYYYPEMEPFLEDIVSYAESAYVKLSTDLDHELRFRVPLVVYKTKGEFQQTNITLQELPDAVGAFAEPIQYRMVLPIDLPPDKLYALIAHELAHIFEYSMFFDGYLGRTIRGRPPTWLMEGLASYLAQDEDNLDRMAIRDAVVNNILPSVEQLNQVTFLTYRYGHAIFDFIEQEHGKEGLRSFLFEFRKSLFGGGVARAIKESFGYDVEEFDRRFNRYLRRKYFPVLLEKKSPDDYGTEIRGPRQRQVFTASPSLSPSGELIAALSAPKMELDLVVLSAEDGSRVKNLTKGWTNKYRSLEINAFEGKRDLCWAPNADRVAVFARRENRWPLLIFNTLTGDIEEQYVFEDIFELASPVYSPDGTSIAFEGNRDGVVDIFEVNLETREVRNLTQDSFFDANPWYSADGKTLLYNRRIGPHWKIFSVDREDPARKTQLTFGQFSDIQPSYSRDGSRIFFSSDRSPYGVFNIYSLDLSSGEVAQYTDLVGGGFAPVEMAPRGDEDNLVFTAFFEGSFRLYRMPVRAPELRIDVADRMAETVEAEPFVPELQLSVDKEKSSPYKLKWDIEAPSIEVGVADDGTFLSAVAIQFSDLLGNHRIFVSAGSVSEFASYGVEYLNLKHRWAWGARAFDYRDYFVDNSTGEQVKRNYKVTGLEAYAQYPFSRHYRFELNGGARTSSDAQIVGFDVFGFPIYRDVDDTFAIVGASLVGDTTRYQRWGPFQGKRFRIGATYGPHISGDFKEDFLLYEADFRAYKQLTRRSLLAWRVSGLYNGGDRQFNYGFGGLNQLRGYEFRQFVGSNIAWTNLEFRFPLVDLLAFPILPIFDIRGFFFLDAGAAWFDDDRWYDPNLGAFRVTSAGEEVPFSFWDSDNGRFQDARASWGWGFQFLFLGGLQFNWVFVERFPYTEYLPVIGTDGGGNLIITDYQPVKNDGGDTRTEFYIQFDF